MSSVAEIEALVADLFDETSDLEALLRGMQPRKWAWSTPAAGWDVSAQVAHLCVVDDRALSAITAPEKFAELRGRDVATALLGDETEECRQLPPADLLDRFIQTRDRLCTTAIGTDPCRRVPWYGPEMGLASMVTARLMESFAHGQDIRDAVGLAPTATNRLRHIAHLGVATRSFSFQIRGLPVPKVPVGLELLGSAGERWDYGAADCPDRVSGTALDFCLVVTQRRHVLDTGLVVTPGAAADWLAIAQAYAGPPGEGRQPGQFAVKSAVARPST